MQHRAFKQVFNINLTAIVYASGGVGGVTGVINKV